MLFGAACVSVIGLPDVPDVGDAGLDADTPDVRADVNHANDAAEDSPPPSNGVCEAGARQCLGNSAVQTCVSGSWGAPVTCTNQVCVGGMCSGACSPATTRCTSNTQVQTCGTNGQWGAATTCPYACSGANCAGVCVANAKQCAGNGVQTCGTNGQWGNAVACGSATPFCVGAGVCLGPNCTPGGAGLTNCGASSESCCTSSVVPGGTFLRTYSPDGDGGTTGSDPATVSQFRMDKYEVTVGRFRQFVTAWNGGAGWLPSAGSGKHTQAHAGQGLAVGGSAGTYEPGWVTSDNSNLAPTNANLACNASYATWTPSVGGSETLPINCVNWWEAYAFCIWDGGFLPSEAEWEYVAAGGSQYRVYPWGSTGPGTTNQYAIYGCYYPTGSGSCTGVKNAAPVGTAPQGAGLWGQVDLGGEVWEWNLDLYASSYLNPCTDCANLGTASDRVFRGGSFYFSSSGLQAQYRSDDAPAGRYYGVGFRCARAP